MNYTQKQVEAATSAGHDNYISQVMKSNLVSWNEIMRAALSAVELTDPDPDPKIIAWTPEQGPLADALAGLPDGHPVTVRGDWGELHGVVAGTDVHVPMGVATYCHDEATGITSATWRKPQPTWATPRPPLVVAGWTGVVHALRADGTYGYCVESKGVTAREFDHTHHGQVRVLIDADGNHVEES